MVSMPSPLPRCLPPSKGAFLENRGRQQSLPLSSRQHSIVFATSHGERLRIPNCEGQSLHRTMTFSIRILPSLPLGDLSSQSNRKRFGAESLPLPNPASLPPSLPRSSLALSKWSHAKSELAAIFDDDAGSAIAALSPTLIASRAGFSAREMEGGNGVPCFVPPPLAKSLARSGLQTDDSQTN